MKKFTLLWAGLMGLSFTVQAQRPSGRSISGGIYDGRNGQPLTGATVQILHGARGVLTDASGHFTLPGISPGDTLLISSVGYRPEKIVSGERTVLEIRLQPALNTLDETVVMAYGTTTRRLNTGSISRITAEEIGKQPVTNVLAALSGRMPGVFVQTTNGLPGGNINVQIRGKGSILAGTNPLYIIDGVPFLSSSMVAGTVLGIGVNGALSPFNTINPSDIESISVLKDADATAIYGSRGANGVVLITTKKGRSDKTQVDISFNYGISNVSNLPRLLNLQQYLQIRREAFQQDGKIPSSDPASPEYAPDLTVWDTTRATDWAKYMLGGIGHVANVQASISGGNKFNHFLISANYRTEGTILPGENGYLRAGLHTSLQHTSGDEKFYLLFSSTYSGDQNRIVNPSGSLGGNIFLPPNFPLYDESGSLNWYLNSNPIANIKARSKSETRNVIGSLVLQYEILPKLKIKTDLGYQRMDLDQIMTTPGNTLYLGSPNSTTFGKNSNQSIIVEPQFEYSVGFDKSSFVLLVGGTWNRTVRNGETILAKEFSNESLMEDLGAARIYTLTNRSTVYKYASLFSRLNYKYDKKYLLNISARRDGSSRFGPGDRFGSFGSIGVAWLVSEEDWIRRHLPFISYAKIRANYGITGNDQISDYQYLSTYSSSSYLYQGKSTLKPSRISNSDFHWESVKKLELALETGFAHDRVLLSINHYRSKSDDQLVAYSIPSFTGFNSYQANLPAVVQNTGWEFELNTQNIRHAGFYWTTTLNLSLTKNELKEFKDFATSSYAKTLALGEDITRVYGYRLTEIDPETGLAHYAQVPNTTSPYYYYSMGKMTPDFFGGIGNTLSFRNWQLDIFGQFVGQDLTGGLTYSPGLIQNNYAFVLGRWQKKGDRTTIPRSSTINDFYYPYSSANYFDATYFRLKNISLSYRFPSSWLSRAKIRGLTANIEVQNLFTIWNRKSALYDPESGALTASGMNIPPLRSFMIGLQLSL